MSNVSVAEPVLEIKSLESSPYEATKERREIFAKLGDAPLAPETASASAEPEGSTTPPAPAPARPVSTVQKGGLTFPDWFAALNDFNLKFCYIVKANLIVRLADMETYNPTTFINSQYGNCWYEGEDKKGNPKDFQVAKQWMTSQSRNQRDKMTYAPGQPRFCGDKGTVLNRWRELGPKPIQGDISPWNELLDSVFKDAPKEREYFEQWAAYPLRHPGAKLKTAVVFYSPGQGRGKNSVAEALGCCYGLEDGIKIMVGNAKVIDEDNLVDSFNAWQKDRQFIIADEIQGGGGPEKAKNIEKLKLMITSPTVDVNEKFQPKFTIPNVANYCFLTNNCSALHISPEDRRFWIWEIKHDESLDEKSNPESALQFWDRFHAWKDSPEGIAALRYHLEHLDLTGFGPNSRAPMTSAKEEMIELSRTEPERWALDLTNNNRVTLFTTNDLLNSWQAENPGSRVGTNAIHKALKKSGYQWAHGGKQIKSRGKQLRLWVVANTEETKRLLAMEPSALAAEYERQHPADAADFLGDDVPTIAAARR